MGDSGGSGGQPPDPEGSVSAAKRPGSGDSGDEGVDSGFDVTLHADGVTFGSDDVALLRFVDETGSLNAAAQALGRSHSRAHKRLRDLEGAFGQLVESRRGGAGGGGSELTVTARRLLAHYERLRTEFSGVTSVAETVFDGRVVERDGELAVVETAAGRIRARLAAEAAAVHVTVRADTVTLHDVDSAPAPSQTSARNRFEGTVVELDERDSVVRVALDVGLDRRLTALVTAASKRELDLGPGSEVVASFKTTATRASPRE